MVKVHPYQIRLEMAMPQLCLCMGNLPATIHISTGASASVSVYTYASESVCLSICPSIPSSIEFWLIQLMHQVGGLQTLLGCSRCSFLSTSNKSVGQRTTVSPGQRSRVMLMIQPPNLLGIRNSIRSSKDLAPHNS